MKLFRPLLLLWNPAVLNEAIQAVTSIIIIIIIIIILS